MAKKYLGEKAVFNRLEKYFKSQFTEAELDRAEFYSDQDGEAEWAWIFELDGKTHILLIDRYSGKIEHKTR